MTIILIGTALFVIAVAFLLLAASAKSPEEQAFDQQIEQWYELHPEQRPNAKKGVPTPPPAARRNTRRDDARKQHMQ